MPPKDNPFTTGPLGRIFAQTALPIVFVMSMNGLLTVVDAIFLGHYVGADALAAVTLIFPIFMMLVALSTLVAGGMSSELARDLGAQDMARARGVYAGAHGLALSMGALLILAYVLFGQAITLFLADGGADLAAMAQTYLGITTFMAPLAFVLAVNSDALRNEGHVGFMAAMSLLVSLSNIGFNYVLIAVLGMGVAGSAYGTALAQLLTLSIILWFRRSGRTILVPGDLLATSLRQRWGRILALGAPQSLNFMGVALGSAAVIIALQWVDAPRYDATVSAYGIITRVLTFGFLPLLGLSYALQSIVGNNYGAQAYARSDHSLRLGLGVALIYCIAVQLLLSLFPEPIARMFVSDPAVIGEFTRILPVTIFMLWLMGPMLIIASYFQALGDAPRAAILGLSKPYLFALPLTFILPGFMGEWGIWLAGPIAEVLMALLTLAVLVQTARTMGLRRGLFTARIP